MPYRERAHLQIIHRVVARRAGGGTTVPVLVCGQRVFAESNDILREADTHLAPGWRLYPEDPRQAGKVCAVQEEFDERLGPATRRWIYHGIRDRRDLAERYGCTGVPGWERRALSVFFPAMMFAINRFLDITPETAAQAESETREIFDGVARRLADGRPYLCGERFTAADLSFAAMAAPVLVPAEYGVPLPAPEELPTPVAAVVRELRAHPAGAYAMSLYAAERESSRS